MERALRTTSGGRQGRQSREAPATGWSRGDQNLEYEVFDNRKPCPFRMFLQVIPLARLVQRKRPIVFDLPNLRSVLEPATVSLTQLK